GGECGDDEERAPLDEGVDRRREEVANGPAALQDARGDAAAALRPVLHRERRPARPLGAHAEAEEDAQRDDPTEGGGERDRAVAEREPDDGDEERELPPEPICEGAGDEAAEEARSE